jgi:hypothetical protein
VLGLWWSGDAQSEIERPQLQWQLQGQYSMGRLNTAAGNNPENRILQLDKRSHFVELQPELTWQHAALTVAASPRFRIQQRQDAGRNSDENEVDLRYWQLKYTLDSYWFKAGRYVNLWGPARMISPSNRYHLDSNRSNPEIELAARDYVEAGTFIGEQWQVQVIHNVAAGEQQLNDFKASTDLQIQWTGDSVVSTWQWSDTAAGSAIGGHSSWTVNDALLWYVDFLLQPSSNTQFAQDSGRQLSLIHGISYTLESGLNLTLDHLYQQQGMTATDLLSTFQRHQQYSQQLWQGQATPEILRLLTEANQQPAFSWSRHYLFLMLQQNEVLTDLDLSLLRIGSLTDQSWQLVLNLSYRLTDDLTLYSTSTWFGGARSGDHSGAPEPDLTDFHRFYHQQHSLGFRYMF